MERSKRPLRMVGTTRELANTWQFLVGYTNTDRASLPRWRISGEAVAFISPGVKELLKRVVKAPSMQKEFLTLPYGHSPRWTTEPRESFLQICCTLSVSSRTRLRSC